MNEYIHIRHFVRQVVNIQVPNWKVIGTRHSHCSGFESRRKRKEKKGSVYRNSQISIKARLHTIKRKRKKVRTFNTPATRKPKTAVVLAKESLVQKQDTSRACNILTTQGLVLKTITTLADHNGSKGETPVAQTTDQWDVRCTPNTICSSSNEYCQVKTKRFCCQSLNPIKF